MKKYIIGILFGFTLAFSITAYGEGNNLIDKLVQGMFPVTVDGISMGNAIVVENKTYLPVREFGESIGYTVSFTDNREVILTKNEIKNISTPITVIQPNSIIDPIQEIYKKTESLEIKSSFLNIAGDYQVLNIDSEQYIQISAFRNYLQYDLNKEPSPAKISIPNKNDFNFLLPKKNRQKYSLGIDWFQYNGITYIKLSSLGLKSTIVGNTFIIEKK